MVDTPCKLGLELGLAHLRMNRRHSATPPKEAIELVNSSPWAGADAPATTSASDGAGSAALDTCSDDDEGEDRLLQDFGPGSCQAARRAPGWSGSRGDPPTRKLDRYIAGERGLRHRIVYEPTELARLLQPRRPRTGARWQLMANVLEAALDTSKPLCESLLLCKAVTDAYLVNRGAGAAAGDRDDAGDLLVQALRDAWRHALAVEVWDGCVDERRHRAVDLHLAASWFQAWEASDDSRRSNQTAAVRRDSAKPAGTPSVLLPDVLPGDWLWVLDQLQDEGDGGANGHDHKDPEYYAKGLHLEEELELEATREKNLGLPTERWTLSHLKRSLLLVSDDLWFQRGGGMIDLRVLGPNRPSTFKKVFSDVPGAIYGCLKDLTGVDLTPPTFRMYTTGDIFEALGADVVVRSRDIGGETEGEVKLGEIELEFDLTSSAGSDDRRTPERKRQVVSLVEVQVTWIGGYTHVLGWLDCVEA